MGQTAQSARASAVLDGSGHDLVTDCWGHGLFITSNSVVCATVQNTLGCTLDKHFGSGSNTGGFLGGAESGHRFTISGKFQMNSFFHLVSISFLTALADSKRPP